MGIQGKRRIGYVILARMLRLPSIIPGDLCIKISPVFWLLRENLRKFWQSPMHWYKSCQRLATESVRSGIG
jgi:hypothetical protein